MSTYKITIGSSRNNIAFNQNKRAYINLTNTQSMNERKINEAFSTANEVLFVNTVKNTESLTKNNNAFANYNYPFNTAVSLGYRIPYLPIRFSAFLGFAPEIYTTEPENKEYKPTFYQKLSEHKNYTRISAFADNASIYIMDQAFSSALDSLFPVSGEIETLSTQQIETLQDPVYTFFYYRSMNGTCGTCVVNGMEMTGSVGYPSGDGPGGGEYGYPLVLTSCSAYYDEIANHSGTSAVMEEFTWTFTYLDGSSINGVSSNPCDELPSDVTDALAYADANQEVCAAGSELFPNIDISFNMYDTELVVIVTGVPPSAPVGTPCSDLFVGNI